MTPDFKKDVAARLAAKRGKKTLTKVGQMRALYTDMKNAREQGLSCEEIAESLSLAGLTVDRFRVSKFLRAESARLAASVTENLAVPNIVQSYKPGMPTPNIVRTAVPIDASARAPTVLSYNPIPDPKKLI